MKDVEQGSENDHLSARAMQRPDTVKQQGNLLFSASLTTLCIPVFPEGVPHGSQFSNGLLDVLHDPRICLPGTARSDLSWIASYALTFPAPTDYPKLRSSSESAFDGLGYVKGFQSFVSHPREVYPSPVARALLMAAMTSEIHPRGLNTAIRFLESKIRESYGRSWTEPHALKLRQVDQEWTFDAPSGRLEEFLIELMPEHRMAAKALFSALLTHAQEESLASPFESWPPTTSETHELGGCPSDDVVSGCEIAIPTTFGSDSTDEWPNETDLGKSQSEEIVQRYSESLDQIHLEGSIIPDTDRALTFPEAEAIYKFLIQLAQNHLFSKQSYASGLAAIVCALMLLTSRSRRQCLKALQDFMQEKSSEQFWMTSDHWHARVFSTDTFGQAPTDSSVLKFESTSLAYSLPFPKELSSLLQELLSKRSSNVASHEDIERATISLRSSLVLDVTPRASETRIRRTLPIALSCSAGDIRIAQMIAGDSLSHSTARLHYFGTTSRHLSSAYAGALCFMGIKSVGSPMVASKIGPPRTALSPESVITAVKELNARLSTVLASHPGSLFEKFNAVATNSAVLLAVALAHRFTEYLWAFTWNDWIGFDRERIGINEPFGCVIHNDKRAKFSLLFRVGILPQLVVLQLRILRKWLTRLETSHSVNGHSLRKVRNALEGKGPLFLWCENKNAKWEIRPMQHGDLESFWPTWGKEFSLWRHIFSTHASDFGITPDDAASQLGHSTGDIPFSDTDPEAPVDVGTRIANPLNNYLMHWGFQVVGELARYQPTKSPHDLPTAREIALADAQYRRQCEKVKQEGYHTLKLKREIYRERCVSKVEAFLTARLPSNNDPFTISQAKVADWITELTTGVSLAEQIEIRLALRRQLKKVQSERKQWTITMTPLADIRRPPVTPFTPANINALKWADRFSEACLSELSKTDTNSRIAALVGLLAVFGGVLTCERMGLVLANRHTARRHFSDSEALIVDIPITGRNDEGSEAVVFSGTSALVLSALTRLKGEITLSKAEDNLMNSDLSSLLRRRRTQSHTENFTYLNEMMTAIGLARKLTQPGLRAAWEIGRGQSVSLSIERIAQIHCGVAGDASSLASISTPNPSDAYRQSNKASINWRRIGSTLNQLRESKITKKDALRTLKSWSPTKPAKTVPQLLAAIATDLLEQQGLKPSTVHSYNAAIAKPLSDVIGERHLDQIGEDDIEDALRRIRLNESSLSTSKKAESAWPTLLAHLANATELEIGDMLDGLSTPKSRARGYGNSPAEAEFIHNTLETYARSAAKTLLVKNPRTFKATLFCNTVARAGAPPRAGEISGLSKNDLHVFRAGQCAVVHIRKRRRRSLKSLASKRPIVLQLQEHERDEFMSLAEELGNRRRSEDHLVHSSVSGPIVESQRRLSATYGSVAQACQPTFAARFHSHRHDYARTSLIRVLPERASEHLATLALPNFQTTTEYLEHLPRRLQWKYSTRQLGHGSPHTSQDVYCNIVGLLGGCDTGLLELSAAQLSVIDDRSVASVQKRRQRGCLYVPRSTPLDSYWRDNPFKVPAKAPFPEQHAQEGTGVASITKVIMKQRQGLDAQAIAQDVNLDESLVGRILEIAKRFDTALKLGYFHNPGNADRTRRNPRKARAQPSLDQLERLLSGASVTPEDIGNWGILPSSSRINIEIKDGTLAASLTRLTAIVIGQLSADPQ